MWNLILYFMIWLPTVFGSQIESDFNQYRWCEYPASGMLLGSKDMLLYVVFLYSGSKAESFGIQAGDFITQIQEDSEAMFIDKEGNLVIAPQYESANIFKYGLAEVNPLRLGIEASKDILMTYINKVGKIIWQERIL